MRGNLKRKFEEVDPYPCFSSSSSSSSSSPSSLSILEGESDGESVSSENHGFTPRSPSSPTSLPSRSILRSSEIAGVRGSVRFNEVTVFSFPRCQGFTSVPSRGGATLGMVRRHSALRRYTVAEHAVEQRHRRREKLRERLQEERFRAFKHKLVASGAIDQQEAEKLTVGQVPHEDVDLSDAEVEKRGFLQLFSSKQRQALLQAAGVKLIDREEKKQLHALRLSREACGCDCQGFCEPETCACSLAGIKCQVDRFNFPCGCTKDGCTNTQGRVEFDSHRVQTHYIHTLMKLELERRMQDETLNKVLQSELPEELQEIEDHREVHAKQIAPDSRCPFGFALEEEGLSVSVPAAPSFFFLPEHLVEEENSCSSDMTEFSCSSSESDSGGYISQSVPEVNRELKLSLSFYDYENDNFSSCRHQGEVVLQHSCSSADSTAPRTSKTFTDTVGRTSVTDLLEENANQAKDILEEDSLGDFPNTPSPSVDYTFSRYMDLSLSSESDLEFFDSDYPSGPLHSSFKGHRHSESIRHLQLFSSFNLPSHESSTHLLESLIGLTEPTTEQIY